MPEYVLRAWVPIKPKAFCHRDRRRCPQNARMNALHCLLRFALLFSLLFSAAQTQAASTVVGSKRFTESYILGELVRQTLVNAGVPAEHKQGLGNTGILEQALSSGAVDVYPEYTGTIVRELLKREGNPSLEELNTWLAPRGLKAAVPLGFNNTYALAVRESQAQALGLTKISDLLKLAPNALKLGLSHEFQARADGWPALQKAYGLPQQAGTALDHGLAYEAIKAQQVDLIDIYSTDAKVGRYALRVLVDDRNFFPRYDAVLLMRAAVDAKPLQSLAGRIDEATMIALNAQVELDGMSFSDAARGFLAQPTKVAGTSNQTVATAASRQSFMARLFAPDLWRLLGQHLVLVFGSLVLAVLVGVPLGVWAWQRPALSGWLLGAVGVLQTIPSLALLAFLIALLGAIGFVPALLALFLYALLPIVRNTHAGLQAVPKGLSLAASALGLTASQSLKLVQLPLARPLMWAGVKTAAVINVGTATMAAFVGAGGLGERIVAGLAVNDNATMLAGALPAAVLAVLVQWLFDVLERRFASGPEVKDK
jgi:osmoprotectant transport system permease protein